MSAPIPLAAPDGTVYAYACGRCRRVAGGVHVPGPVSPVDRLAGLSMQRATRCCVCQCGAAMSPTSRWRACDACSAAHDARLAAQREAHHAALAARGVRVCPECYDLRDGCDTCDETGEVPL